MLKLHLEGIRDALLGGLRRAHELEPEAALREVLRSLFEHRQRTQATARGLKPWIATAQGERLRREVLSSLGEDLADLLILKFQVAESAPRRVMLLMGAIEGMFSATLEEGDEALPAPSLEETMLQVALAVARAR